MSIPRVLLLASLIASKVENGGSIAIANLERDLQRRHPAMTRDELHAAICLAMANGKIMRTFGGAAITRAR